MPQEHGVGLTGALEFGGGANCCRLNFGCSRAALELAVGRMLAALEAHAKSKRQKRS